MNISNTNPFQFSTATMRATKSYVTFGHQEEDTDTDTQPSPTTTTEAIPGSEGLKFTAELLTAFFGPMPKAFGAFMAPLLGVNPEDIQPHQTKDSEASVPSANEKEGE